MASYRFTLNEEKSMTEKEEEFLPPRNIYVTNLNPDYDYSDLERRGQVVYMTRGYINDEAIKKLPKTFNKYFANATDQDVLALSGPPIVCALAVACWLNYYQDVDILYLGGSRDEKVYESIMFSAEV